MTVGACPGWWIFYNILTILNIFFSIIQLQESGFIEKWVSEYWYEDDQCRHERAATTSSVESFSGAFTVMAAMLVAAILAFTVEALIAKALKQRIRNTSSPTLNISDLSLATTNITSTESLSNPGNVRNIYSVRL